MEPWVFGEAPLEQTVTAADLLRRAISLVQAVEGHEAAVDRLVQDLQQLDEELGERVPVGRRPRVGAATGDEAGRVYLDHGRDVGRYNPCFPAYELAVDGARATGTVTFPVAYEGPPGFVHGGFLGVLFDCVVQHHNCEVGVAGKTVSMAVRYRRPTPLLTPLAITVERRVEDGRIHADVQLLDGDRLLCSAEIEAVAGDRAAMPEVSPRRGAP
jgi:acyl-coenzyme A thioesterase PaaI-like protein